MADMTEALEGRPARRGSPDTSRASTSVSVASSPAPPAAGPHTVGSLLAVVVMVIGTVSALAVALLRTELAIASAVAIAALLPAAAVDLRVYRLPDPLVAAAAGLGLLVGLAEWRLGDRLAHITVGRLLLGIALFAGPLLLAHVASPAAMGFGDVKLAVVLGAALAPVDQLAPIVALLIACAIGAVAGAAAGRRTIPFGPALVVGAAVAAAITDQVVAR